MTRGKARLTITVDRELVAAGSAAVAAGSAESLSGWINVAMAERAKKEQRLRAMAEAVAAYESEFGQITQAELIAQDKADRRSALAVRGRKPVRSRRTRRKTG
jgi:hypothetical protein